MSFNSDSTAVTSFPATLAFSILSTSLERPTDSGSRLDSVNSASPKGLERKEEVSPDGISSSAVSYTHLTLPTNSRV